VKTKGLVLLLTMALCVTLTQCSKGTRPTLPPPVNENPSFSGDIQPIFTSNCALSGCHGDVGAYGLTLTAGQSYSLLVNVKSVQVPTLMRVRPALPDSSYVVRKIEGHQTVGVRMPAHPVVDLSYTNTQLVKNWITKGAQYN
jgi:hypothetical protein